MDYNAGSNVGPTCQRQAPRQQLIEFLSRYKNITSEPIACQPEIHASRPSSGQKRQDRSLWSAALKAEWTPARVAMLDERHLGLPPGRWVASGRRRVIFLSGRAQQFFQDRLQRVGPDLVALHGGMESIGIHHAVK